MDAPAIISTTAFGFDAGCESRIKILSLVNPIHYRIFLGTPVRFHKSGFILVLKEYPTEEGVKLKYIRSCQIYQ
jgi:hypothetical protein